MKFFYSHLIEIESLILELNKLDLSYEEKKHLAQLVDSSMHNTIMETILSQLTEDDKKIFLNHIQKSDHEKVWQFLNEKVDKIEDKIKKAVDDLKEELHKDIKEAKEIK